MCGINVKQHQEQPSSQCAKWKTEKPEIINAIEPASKKKNKNTKPKKWNSRLYCVLLHLDTTCMSQRGGGSPALQMGQVASWLCLLRQK